MRIIDFKTSGYFSAFIIFTGIGFVVLGVASISRNPIVAGILLFLSVLIFTTHYRLRIDLDKKTYLDYLWILGFRIGEHGTFEFVDYLFVRRNKVSQKMQLRAASSTMHKEVFDGYLKLSGNHKIHLITNDDKESTVKFLKEKAALLNVPVMDHCVPEPVEL